MGHCGPNGQTVKAIHCRSDEIMGLLGPEGDDKSLLRNMKMDDSGKRVNWLKVNWIRVTKTNPDAVLFKEDFNHSSPFKRVKVLHNMRGEQRVMKPKYKFSAQPPISAEKKTDLLSLCTSYIIPKELHQFYKDLPTNRSVRDTLPEPDVLEDD